MPATGMDQATLQALADFPRQLEAYYGAIPAAFVNWAPDSWDGVPSEPFTALQQICHVRDIEVDGYHVRIRQMRDQDHPVLASIDGEELVTSRQYGSANPAEVLATIRTARVRTVEMIASLTPEQLLRTGEFAGYGTLTLRSLIHYLCSHDQQHLAGLQWLMGRITAAHPAS